MALTKSEELRKKAKVLLDQAKKIEEEAVTKLGDRAAKFLSGSITLAEFRKNGIDLGFDVAGGE